MVKFKAANDLLQNGKAVYHHFKEKNIFTLAAAMSFYAFLSLFPFFVLLISLSTFFAEEAVTIKKISTYLKLFPPSVKDTFMANLQNILESGEVFSVVSFFILIYFALKVFSHLETAISAIFDTEKIKAGWKSNLKAFVFFLFTSFLLLLLFFSGNVFMVVAAKLGKLPFIKSYYFLVLIYLCIETLFFAVSYTYLARKKVGFKNAITGGVIAAVLWEILKNIFGLYIVRVELYFLIYGALGSIVLLLLWFYYSILVYLLGAEISSRIKRS
ncbi:MAG TPA: YihY/virulence factor BrkB family protein [Acidobacteriota bacterium]|nr:YihY/virulence factor BrkB family protein [Acidobacteriota bacterium]